MRLASRSPQCDVTLTLVQASRHVTSRQTRHVPSRREIQRALRSVRGETAQRLRHTSRQQRQNGPLTGHWPITEHRSALTLTFINTTSTKSSVASLQQRTPRRCVDPALHLCTGTPTINGTRPPTPSLHPTHTHTHARTRTQPPIPSDATSTQCCPSHSDSTHDAYSVNQTQVSALPLPALS